MTTIVAAAGGGNWTVGATWVGGVAPTAADDAQLNGTSGNVTIDAGSVARSLDCTGYTATLSHSTNAVLSLGDATAGAGNAALKFVAGMTYTPSTGTRFDFVSTSATQQTITTAGKSMRNCVFGGAGSSYLLADALASTSTFTLSAGTFDTGNFAMSWDTMVISTAGTKTLTLGSSAIAITGSSATAVSVTGTNLTITANTAVLTFSGAAAGLGGGTNWNGMSVVFPSTVSTATIQGGNTLNNVTHNGPATKSGLLVVSNGNITVTGTLTVAGNSTVNRIFMAGGQLGTPRTVTVGTGFSFANVDFIDLTAAGAAGTWTGTSMGNALGNSNITFDPPVTQTRTGAGGNYSTSGNWTSRVPLPQDNVIIGAAASGTITMDMPRLGVDVDFTGFTGTAAFNSTLNTIYGSINLATGMTVSGTQALTLGARSSGTITSNGKTFTQATTISAPGGSYTLADAFGTTGTFTFTRGTFVTAGFAMSANAYALQAPIGDVLNIANSTITASAGSGSPWNNIGAASVTATGSTIVYSTASATARTFAGASRTYGALTYNVAGSTGQLTITGSNTFNTINFSDASNARSLTFTAGTTTTVTNFNVVGTSGKLMTIDSATAANHTLVKAGGAPVTVDYVDPHRSQAGGAGWYAGTHSTDGGNNSGWIFTDAPTSNAAFLMF